MILLKKEFHQKWVKSIIPSVNGTPVTVFSPHIRVLLSIISGGHFEISILKIFNRMKLICVSIYDIITEIG